MTERTEHPARSFYDRISRAYDAIADSGEHASREEGLALLSVKDGERVLEIGYGTGHSLVQLAQAVGRAGHVSGVDISQGMHDVAWRRVQESGVDDRVALCVAEIPPVPYDDGSFDAVTMSFTLELFPQDVIPTVLTEVRRVLRSTGRLGIVSMSTTPDGERDRFAERTYKWMHRHFPHIVDCQPIDAVRFVQEAGFRVTRRVDMTIWTMPVVALVGVY